MIPNDVKDGVSFEYYIQQVFLSDGIQALTTPTTNDYGSDLIVKYKGFTFSIQCKYYTNPVGIKAVQEVMGSLKYYEADYGAVITNSVFTQQAQNLARTNGILLIDASCDFYSFKDYFDSFLEDSSSSIITKKKQNTEWTMEDLVIRYGVSRGTILRNYLGHGLPYTKVGREYRFNEKDVVEWEIERGGRNYGDQIIGLPGYVDFIKSKISELNKARELQDWDKYSAIKKELKEHGYKEFRGSWIWPFLIFVGVLAFILLAYFIGLSKQY